MKVPGSIQGKYDDLVGTYRTIEERVITTLSADIKETWHFEGRVKKPVSFAQKIETGSFDPDDLEDFYACTLVVPTLEVLHQAETLLHKRFRIVRRKPLTEQTAASAAFNFPFDHIRLYGHLRVPPGLPTGPIYERQFEIQIKTFLQHAWSIATHDLTYKATEVSWGTQRVAAQVKATLEAAEIAIVEAEQLAETGNRLLAREDTETTALRGIQKALRDEFESASLPDDMRRLAMTVLATLSALGIPSDRLPKLLRRGRKGNGGSHPSSLSPYGIVLSYLVTFNSARLKRALQRPSGPAIFVPIEVPLPVTFSDRPLASLMTI